jgi:hypothetical protein
MKLIAQHVYISIEAPRVELRHAYINQYQPGRIGMTPQPGNLSGA